MEIGHPPSLFSLKEQGRNSERSVFYRPKRRALLRYMRARPIVNRPVLTAPKKGAYPQYALARRTKVLRCMGGGQKNVSEAD
jgi:hypothetical protein